ncbi:MAG: CRISPR-associated endonuclease Cas2 [Anaerolineales bacterium]|nr:CRISPR-associated endonuclease Cas2 [Anaerolineales bacterium]
MHCLVIYDIPDDRKRSKIADVCLDYGLDRIQYSAFVGKLAVTHIDELMLKIQKTLGKKPGSVHLYPLCQQDWRNRQLIEQSSPSEE